MQRNGNVPAFNENARAIQPPLPPAFAEGQAGVATPPRFQPRVRPHNDVERGGDGAARIEQTQPQRQRPQGEAAAQRIGRPDREMRNIQPRPQQIAPIAPIAPASQPTSQPSVPPHMQPRMQPNPQPQPVEAPRPARIEASRPPQGDARTLERGPPRVNSGAEGPGQGPGREFPNRAN